MRVTKASLLVEIDGQTGVVLLDGLDLDQLINYIACVNGKGKAQVVKLDDTFTWESLKNYMDSRQLQKDLEND